MSWPTLGALRQSFRISGTKVPLVTASCGEDQG